MLDLEKGMWENPESEVKMKENIKPVGYGEPDVVSQDFHFPWGLSGYAMGRHVLVSAHSKGCLKWCPMFLGLVISLPAAPPHPWASAGLFPQWWEQNGAWSLFNSPSRLEWPNAALSNVSFSCSFKFSSSGTLKNEKKDTINFNNIFYLTQYGQNTIILTCKQYRKSLRCFTLFFIARVLESCIYFTFMAHVNSDKAHLNCSKPHVPSGSHIGLPSSGRIPRITVFVAQSFWRWLLQVYEWIRKGILGKPEI